MANLRSSLSTPYSLLNSDSQYDFNFVPGLTAMGYPHTAINYNYTTVPQSGLGNRNIDMVGIELLRTSASRSSNPTYNSILPIPHKYRHVGVSLEEPRRLISWCVINSTLVHPIANSPLHLNS